MNTTGFKHFKLHSDSTLKSMRKDKLIDYIHMLYHNWQGTDESFMNISIYVEKLSEKEKPKKPELVDVRFRQRGRRYGELGALISSFLYSSIGNLSSINNSYNIVFRLL